MVILVCMISPVFAKDTVNLEPDKRVYQDRGLFLNIPLIKDWQGYS